MTTAGPSQRHSPHPVAPSYHSYRHHPYAQPTPAANGNAKPRANGHTRSSPNGDLPPSPPRSRRDVSETPSIGLGVAFGGSGGGKWWDEELPPPPASLSSILDSFRKSGEGDRDLLLSILGAKKAEEERLTALIQTRLTVLQARLSLHSAAASLNAMPMVQAPSSEGVHASPNPSTTVNADASSSRARANSTTMPPPPFERTPSLTSSRGPGSTSDGIASPPLPSSATYIPAATVAVGNGSPKANAKANPREKEGRGYWQLPSLQSSLRPPQLSQGQGMARSPVSPSHNGLPLAPIREVRIEDGRRAYARSSGSISPKSHASADSQRRDRSGSGLEMLLDAGRVVNESAERDV